MSTPRRWARDAIALALRIQRLLATLISMMNSAIRPLCMTLL